MIYTNPQRIDYLDEVEGRGALDRHFETNALEAKKRQARFLLSLLAQHAGGREVLDFGCGAGAFVAAAKEDGWQPTGYDLNGGLVQAARAHWGIDKLHTGPLEEFYASHRGSFDAISCFQVFEHLQQPVPVGKELVSLLKPGGVLLIDVPYVHQPREWISRGKTLDPTSHWCHFSLRTLSDLMRRIDCELVYRSAAPSFVSLYHRLGLKRLCVRLGIITKTMLPPIGSGVCVIGRKPNTRSKG